MTGTASLDDLLRQARRLRFDAAAREERFWSQRVDALILRSRIMIVAGLLMVAVNGLLDWQTLQRVNDPVLAEFFQRVLWLRAVMLGPAWLTMLGSTFMAGHVKRADRLNVVATIVGLSALVLMRWLFAQAVPGRAVVGPMVGDLALVSVLSVMTLPMRFRRLAVGLSLWAMATVALFAVVFWPERSGELWLVLAGIATTVGTSLLFLWRRETDDRVIFVQREHVESLNGELAARNAELTALNAEKSEFMAIAAHDLRAPLASVRGFAELLRDGRLQDEAKQRGAIEQIENQSARMLQLVTDYLGAHAAESGGLAATLQAVDVGAAVEAAVARMEPTARAKGQRLAVVAGEAGRVRADAAWMGQVLDNYLSNAVKFSPAGSVVRLGWRSAEAGRVRIEVADRGPGIAPDERVRLFRKFSRASARPTAGEASHGLGLAVVKRLAETMGGTVGCESEPGQGATFWMELPAGNDQKTSV